MKKQSRHIITGLAAGALWGLAAAGLQAAEVTVLQESFETDGLGTRYFAIGGGDNGETDFFARREQFSAGTDASGGTIDGDWFWGASDIDNINEDLPSDLFPDLGARDGVLLFDDIDVSGLGDLRIDMAVAQGQGTFEPDNHFQIQVRFDDVEPGSPTFGSGEWVTIGGFRSVSTNTPGRYFSGPLRLTTDADPRLTSEFQEWSWDIWGFGSTMDVRIVMNSNWRDEDYYVDNVRIIGDDSVVLVDVSIPDTELVEPESSETIPVTFTSNEPAPSGGLTLDVLSDVWVDATLPMPETVTIPEGESSLTVDLEHLADGRFTGTKVIEALFTGDGVSREVLRFKVENTTPKPKVLIMEVLNLFPGTIESDIIGDANGDGARTYPGDLFVEVVNFEDFPVDLTEWTIEDDLGPRFEFPEGTTIDAGRSIVIFGGGEPLGVFGGADVLTVGTSNGFAFNTTRAEIAGMFAPFGGEMEIVDLPFRSQMLETTLALPESDPAFGETASIHRESDEVGSEFTFHSLIDGARSSEDSLYFSPGARPDGTPYFTPSSEVTVQLGADTAMEGDAGVDGTISLSSPAPSGGLPLVISATGEGEQVALSEKTITVPEGQSTASFTVTPIDDDFLDGPITSSVVVNGEEGSDVLGGLATITIEDNETNPYSFEISEFLIDLTGTGEDPNLDGNLEQSVADQFIEVVNRSGFPVVVDGWSLIFRVGGQFALKQRGHTFGDGTVLQDSGSAVIFGEIFNSEKSDPVFAGALVDDASNDDSNGGLHAEAGRSVFIDLVNEFGFPVTQLEIPAELTGQGMSVAVVDGTPVLHLEAAGGFNLFSPGTQPDGTPYPGNGPWAPQGVLGDITRTASSPEGVLGYSESMGWLFMESWPAVFNYADAGWWAYLLTTDLGNKWYYDYDQDDYLWINPGFYPWVYSLNIQDWKRVGGS